MADLDNIEPTDSAPLEGEVMGASHSRVLERRMVENVMEDSYLRYSMSVISIGHCLTFATA